MRLRMMQLRWPVFPSTRNILRYPGFVVRGITYELYVFTGVAAFCPAGKLSMFLEWEREGGSRECATPASFFSWRSLR